MAVDQPEYDVVVIGAGFSGLFAAHRLAEQGFSVRGFERGSDVGGVWFWNRYPGARCDCESYYYSYSFSDELQREWSWSLKYSEQPEILRYLSHVADRFDIRRHFRFGTSVISAVYDEDALLWRVTTGGDHPGTVTARFVVAASGCLSQEYRPDIPGLDDFTGEILSTSSWPQDGVDFTGKRVGIIGTGASGVQVITRIAPEVDHLTVFQRSANWVIPVWNEDTGAEFDAWTKDNHREIRERCETSWRAVPYDRVSRRISDVPPEDRRAVLDEHWKMGGPRFLESFSDLLVDTEANDAGMAYIREQIVALVDDPAIAKRLTPKTHRLGSRRPVMEDGYYETFNRANVSLADIAENPITGFDGRRVRTADGDHELDILILATGFDGITGSLLAMDIRGRDGITLRESWSGGTKSYLGLGIAGFPNLFTITGPFSPSVLVNMPTALEQHVEWITNCLKAMRERGLSEIEARPEAQNKWVAQVSDMAAKTFFEDAASWYVGSNIPGKNKQFLLYPAGFSKYKRYCDQVVNDDYDGFLFKSA